MRVLVDYLTMTTKLHSMEQCLKMLGLDGVEGWQQIKSFFGYDHCMYLDGIRIHWTDNLKLSEVCIDMSGKGCRTLEYLNHNVFDWLAYFRQWDWEAEKGINVSRMDIACDDLDGILDFDKMVKYTKARRYICKATCKPYWEQGRKRAIYFGSEKSDRLLRIYDKALEQRNMLERKNPELAASLPEHWIRAEFQLRNDNARSFLLNWLKVGELGKCYSGVMRDFLRFVTKLVEPKVSHNYDALHLASWWQKFLGWSLSLKQCYVIGRERTVADIEQYVEDYAGSALRTVVEAHEGDLTPLLDIIDGAKLNPRHEQALELWKQQRGDSAEVEAFKAQREENERKKTVEIHESDVLRAMADHLEEREQLTQQQFEAAVDYIGDSRRWQQQADEMAKARREFEEMRRRMDESGAARQSMVTDWKKCLEEQKKKTKPAVKEYLRG